MSLQVGIVGLRRGGSLARVFALMPECRVAVGCDADATQRQRFAEAHPQARLCASVEELLDSGPDLCAIASPVPLHAAHTLQALKAGCHVLQEVCLAASVEQCRQILDAVLKHPRQKFMFAENCNYWAHILSWQRLWEEGLLGHFVHGEAEYVHDVRALMRGADGAPTWRDTLPPIHYCTHSLGPLLKITGERVVSAVGLSAPARQGPGQHASQVALLQTSSGGTIKILAAFGIARQPSFHYYSLYGTRGCLETSRPPAPFKTHAWLESVPHLQNMIEIPLTYDVPGAPASARAGGHGTAEYYMVRAFLDSILKDLPSPIDIHAALAMSLPGLCAHQSALEGGRPVPVPDWRPPE